MTDEELLEFCTVLLLGGFDNTLRLLANAIYRLGRNKELRHRLVADPHLIPSAIEEFMRLDAPACIFRLAKCRDPEQTWGRLSHSTLDRTRVLAKSGKPLTKEICQLAVEDSAANLKQLMSPLRGPAHGLLLAHSLIN